MFFGCSSKDKPNEVVGMQLAPQPSSSIAQVSQNIPKEKVEAEPCPSGMVHVVGKFCTKSEKKCIKWLEPPEKYPRARCKEFAKSKCIGDRIEMNYCIDAEEFTYPSEDVPASNITWDKSKELCESQGKKLCTEPEWQFACEGEDILPYPTGYIRPTGICHIDEESGNVCGKTLCDKRATIKEYPMCLSPFKVHNMVGNVDEWVSSPMYAHSKNPKLFMPSILKGGHWLPIRAQCSPKTQDHENHVFSQVSIGTRCCK